MRSALLQLATCTPSLRKRRAKIDDAAFVDALDFEYRDAPAIAREMLKQGTPATLAVIRARMAEFVENSDEIEGQGDSWRIVSGPPPAPSNGNVAMPSIRLHNGCGLELMRSLPDASVDLVLCDLPYGTTRSAFDPLIDVSAWLAEMRRIVTPLGVIVAFCTQPFTTDLMNAGRDMWKSEIVWEKPNPTGFAQSHRRMMKAHETILVFSKGTVCGGDRSKRHMTYNPIGVEKVVTRNKKRNLENDYHGQSFSTKAAVGDPVNSLRNCPRDVVYFPKDKNTGHPFAKPIALLDYLIRTYSNEGDTVLDPTMGSGSTGVACAATGRKFIGAENGFKKNGDCVFAIAEERIAKARAS